MQSKHPVSAAKCKRLYSRVDYKYGLFHEMSMKVGPGSAFPQEKKYGTVVISTASSVVFLIILLLLFPSGRGVFLQVS